MTSSFQLPRALGSLVCCTCALSALVRPAIADAPVAAHRTDQPKPYTLFMGTDISVQLQKVYHRVHDVSGNSFIVSVHGEPKFVSFDRKQVGIRVEPAMKLAAFSATVDNLKIERGYTPETDPRLKFIRENPGGVATALRDAANAAERVATQKAAQVLADPHASTAVKAAAMADASSASAKAQNASLYNSLTDPAYYAGQMAGALEKEAYDAIDVHFAVSSPTRLTHPYVVLVTTFHDPNGKPGEVGKWIFASSLDPIDDKPQKVRLRQGGFPPGFELKDSSLHLYNLGSEVATNVAANRVALSRDDAFQYTLVEYLLANRAATRSATLTLMALPQDLPERLRAGQYPEVYYLKVGKSGVPTGGYLDEACTRAVSDAYLRQLFQNLRFRPALTNGQPVEAVVPVSLNQLRT